MDELESLPIVISGATGKMGRNIVRTVLGRANMHLAGALGHARHLGEDIGELVNGESCGVMVSADVDEVLDLARGGVLVEVSTGVNVKNVVLKAFERNIACVVGTSNIPLADEEEITAAAKAKKQSLLLAPNFALGAVLMMKFAMDAARYFRWAEIVELHHERKLDAPSGTAKRTAELMLRSRSDGFRSAAEGEESVKGARGGNVGGIRIHSVRLPGMVAHQEVIFGNTEETLHIRHDATGRECFMSGVLLAIEKVRQIDGVAIGLENVID